jgi:DNA repair exonuclease SbcCD ATPase subunit
MGFKSLDGTRSSLVDLEVRSLSLRAAKKAARETLAAQRNVNLKAVYSEIARVWEMSAGREGWSLELDGRGMLVVSDPTGREFDLSQFSGGEKTALLVIIHTIMARNFSKSDFLMIDEPLEHLDPVNRRSLIRFLTSALQKGALDQLIITTFEESLTRKYISEEGVSIIYL